MNDQQAAKSRVLHVERSIALAQALDAEKRQCRQCERDRTKQRYHDDPAAKNQKTIAHRRAHKEPFNAYRREWTKRNREMIEAYRQMVGTTEEG